MSKKRKFRFGGKAPEDASPATDLALNQDEGSTRETAINRESEDIGAQPQDSLAGANAGELAPELGTSDRSRRAAAEQAAPPDPDVHVGVTHSGSTRGREVSIFGPAGGPAAPTRAPGPERTARGPEKAPGVPARSPGSDTIKMQSVPQEPARTAPGPGGRPTGTTPMRPPRLRPPARPADLPRRRYTARNRFGIFSFFFGLFGLFFKMVFVTILVMAIAGFLSYEAVRAYIKTPEVTVPDVRGKKIGEAVNGLAEKKLALYQERAEASALVAPGEIISQRPLPGMTTKERTSVRVVVSSGRATFVVPDLVGETRENALNKIKGARLEVGDVTDIESEKSAKDIVITQDPEAGKGLDQSTKVNLLISSGPRGSSFTMPDLTGRSVADAQAALSRLGVTNVSVDPPDSANGTVIGHDPLVGKMMLQSQPVVLKARK